MSFCLSGWLERNIALEGSNRLGYVRPVLLVPPPQKVEQQQHLFCYS